MYCSQCGAQLADEARFCTACGTRVTASSNESERDKKEDPAVHEDEPRAVSSEAVKKALKVRPWIRFWARMFDVAIFSIAASFLIIYIFPDAFIFPGGDQVLGLLTLFLWVFVEAWLLRSFGTTPGKSLFKISLLKTTKPRFDYADGLRRSLKVWWRGIGIGFPIVTLATMIIAYNKLLRNGRTTWDSDEGIVVQHGDIGPIRTIFAILFFSTFFMLIIISASTYA